MPVKTTIQMFYVKGLFDIYGYANEVLKDYLFTEVNERLGPDLEEHNDGIVRK